jgi:hypothetical protein
LIGTAEEAAEKRDSRGVLPQALKARLIGNDLQNAEASLFHGTAGLCEFFRSF